MARTPFVAGNWKMFKLRAEACSFADGLLAELDDIGDVDLAVCPPATALADVATSLVERGVAVLAQNGHEAAEGAFTGELSMSMIRDAGATGVLLGHSERRQYFAESDEAVGRKAVAALAAGLETIICVGESDAEREAGQTDAVLTRQVTAALRDLDVDQVAGIVIAYEPVWAIGTGKTATPELAQTAHAHIRAVVADGHGAAAATAVRILYGGSVKPDNARALFAERDIDGGLIGGASLDVASFLAIARAALP